MVSYWHFSFTVSNLEKSVAFYTQLLGMQLVQTHEQAGEFTSKLVAHEDAHLKIAYLTLHRSTDGEVLLELVEYLNPRHEAAIPPLYRPGSAHLAFRVEDCWAEYHRLRAKGIEFKSEPTLISGGLNKGGYACYFLDPDQIPLQLIQVPHRPLLRR